MAALNLSTNGPSISKSYQSVVNATTPSGSASQSPTFGQWAVFSVSAPLANAFQHDGGGKESVLKVQGSGEGDLADLIEEFSDGKIQFAFAKIKDPNTTLPKSVLIGWCGEGVPERTKGYFTSHLAVVSKTLQGYHVQITARSDRDLTPESIIQKVSEASGSKYGGGSSAGTANAPPPPISSKPAFTPTRSSAGAAAFNPLAGSRTRQGPTKSLNVDKDGWGDDAPPITRTELEKVPSAYQPTKVNLRDSAAEQPSASDFKSTSTPSEAVGVVKGAYQPIGKVDIAAIRREAQRSGTKDDRPEPVKGSYEPVGKVDIAAIRARAQPPPAAFERDTAPAREGEGTGDRPTAFNTSERLTTLPKPKVSNRFGGGTSSFVGTKAPTPGGHGLESKSVPAPPASGVGRTFADQGGKTPAQLWAEKRAKAISQAGDSTLPSSTPPLVSQTSGGAQWKSSYQGKSWAPVQTTRTGQSASSLDKQDSGDREESTATETQTSTGGIGALRDRFKAVEPIEDHSAAPAPPPLDTSNKPNAGRGVPMPVLPSRLVESEDPEEPEAPRMPSPPPQPPRSPTPPTPQDEISGSPIRIAMPVSRGHNEQEVEDARDEQLSPPPAMPARSLAAAVPHEDELSDEPGGHDPARAIGATTAATTFGAEAANSAHPGAQTAGKRAVVQYDYEKAEDNEIELREGEHVVNIEMVDENWWMGENVHGESGLFPSNYVELIEGEEHGAVAPPASISQLHHEPEPEPTPTPTPGHTATGGAGGAGGAEGATATALYDYEAAEDNELSFPENAKITGIEFPDDDWWSGEYAGRQGLFPANYVQLNK